METIGKIRRRLLVKQGTISGIARDLGLSRNTVKRRCGRCRDRRPRTAVRPLPDGYNPWHYVSALEHKAGALRTGAPFKDGNLPAPMTRLRERLS